MTTARAVEGHLRYRMEERDNRLRERYRDRLASGPGRRALMGRNGRLLADDAAGWLRGTQLELPPGGGDLILPSGASAFAEPVGSDEPGGADRLTLPPVGRVR
jgi:hypothetical protein